VLSALARRETMKTTNQLLLELQGMGWRLEETQKRLYSFNKECCGDVDVLISIRTTDSGYDVLSSAEHRCSGPSEAIIASVITIDEALEKLMECCKGWDKRMHSEVDWSKCKLISPPSDEKPE
jgi:hypothetical protein